MTIELIKTLIEIAIFIGLYVISENTDKRLTFLEKKQSNIDKKQEKVYQCIINTASIPDTKETTFKDKLKIEKKRIHKIK